MWLSDHIFLTEVKMAAFTLPNESFKEGILKAQKNAKWNLQLEEKANPLFWLSNNFLSAQTKYLM